MLRTFKGGVHPEDGKKLTRQKSIEVLPAPKQVVLPMDMHVGAHAVPIVKVGDHVALGQKVAASVGAISAPVHASVSGTVVAVEPRPSPSGVDVLSVVIENDFKNAVSAECRPMKDWAAADTEALIGKIHDAGIVGLGGAAFPTDVKIRSGLGKVDRLLINGAECEPYITSGHRLMLERSDEILSGIEILLKIYNLKKAYIGIESNKYDAVEFFESKLTHDSPVSIVPLKTKYPQGAEKQFIQAVIGRKVPPGELPAAVGCAVYNVDTAIAIHNAIHMGMPLLYKVLTVSGPVVANPKNLEVRIGTPVSQVIEGSGGFKEPPVKVLFGGPMMGVAQYDMSVPVIKSTNAVLGMDGRDDPIDEDPVCIHCGKCIRACPMNLMPLYINMYAEKGLYDKCEQFNALDCMECGSCAFACLKRLHLVQSIRDAKAQILQAKKQQAK